MVMQLSLRFIKLIFISFIGVKFCVFDFNIYLLQLYCLAEIWFAWLFLTFSFNWLISGKFGGNNINLESLQLFTLVKFGEYEAILSSMNMPVRFNFPDWDICHRKCLFKNLAQLACPFNKALYLLSIHNFSYISLNRHVFFCGLYLEMVVSLL